MSWMNVVASLRPVTGACRVCQTCADGADACDSRGAKLIPLRQA